MINPRSFPRRTSNARLRPQYEQLERRVLLANDLQLDLKSFSDYEQPAASWFSRIDHQAAQAATIAAGGASTEWFDNFVGPRRYQQHDWIVRLTPAATASLRTLDELSSKLNQSDIEFRVVAGLGLPGLVHVQSLSNSEESVRTSLSHNDRIASFSANEKVGGQLVPNDSSFGNMTNLNNVGQFNATPDADIDTPEAWDRTTGSTQVVVGVIDSGVDAAHPDLYLNMWLNQGEIPSTIRSSLVDTDGDGLFTFYDLNQNANNSWVRDLNGNTYIDAIDLLEDPLWADGRDTDGNGFVDDFFGWNFRTDSNEPFAPNNPSDNLGHGTHVAGTIGAIGDNGRGIAGINWRSSIMALKFLDQSNQGELASAISAIHYATMMRTQFGTNVRVLNNSWGQPGGENALLRDAIAESGDAGILFVAAAGNGNILGQGVDNDRVPFYPASYDLPNVIAVAASDSNDRLATFSNYGQRSVDIAAPGVGVLSTLPGGRYGEANGTSMATPHVSGVVALVWSEQFAATPEEVITAIKLGSDALPTLQSRIASGGRLNAPKALSTPVFAPAAIVVSAPNITTATSQSQEITVRYSHRDGIDAQSIGDNDLMVLRRWGPKDSYYPTLKPGSVVPDGNGFRATYILNAPGGGWDPLDYGPYEIQIQRKAVYGTQGLAVREGSIGQFRVKIDDPSVFYVNTTTDTLDANPGDGVALDAGGKTSLRAAIMEANAAGTASQTIILDPGFYNLSIAPIPDANFQFMVPGPGATVPPGPPGWSDVRSGDLDVHGTLSIFGDDDGTSVIDAQLLDRVFKVHPNATLNLSRVTAQYGRAPAGQDGGAILSAGTLNVSLSTIAYSSTQHSGGGIAVWQGSVNISQSTVWHNNAQLGGGMLLSNNSTMNIDSSTFAFNEAPKDGGAILSWYGGEGQIINSTLSRNESQITGAVASFPNFQLNGLSDLQLSADGRFFAFSSNSSNLTPGDSNKTDDVFVYDRQTFMVERVSVSNIGEPGNKGSYSPSLSRDGQLVAFMSNASNFIAGDTGDSSDVFVHNRQTHSIECISVSDNGERGNGASFSPSLSADGRFIAFESSASNLVPGDTNGKTDVFVYDRQTRTIDRISVSASGAQGNDSSGSSSLSADGWFIAFESSASNFVPGDTNGKTDVFVYDRQTRTIDRISVSAGDAQGNDSSVSPSLSADGRFIAFESSASNLVPGDTNNHQDIFVHDRHSRATRLISISGTSEPANSHSFYPLMDANGEFVAFKSSASNLVSGDTNNTNDIFVYNVQQGLLNRETAVETDPIWQRNVTVVENRGAAAIYGNVKTGNSLFVRNQQTEGIPAVAWETGVSSLGYNLLNVAAPGLLASSDQLVADAFRWLGPIQDNGGPTWTHALLPGSSALDAGNPGSSPAIDQRGIARPQDADGLSGARADIGALEAYLGSIQGTIFLDRNSNGRRDSTEQGVSHIPVYVDENGNNIHDDNEFMTLTSTDDFTTQTVNEQGVFRIESTPGQYFLATQVPWGWTLPKRSIEIFSVSDNGEQGNGWSYSPSLSADGRFVAFDSLASNLVPGDTNNSRDIFVYDRQLRMVERISVSDNGQQGNGWSDSPSLSADGRFVAFGSVASNLVPGDTDNSRDIFVYDRQFRIIERISVSDNGEQGNGWSDSPSLSADGRFVAFDSVASNLIPGDNENIRDVFVHLNTHAPGALSHSVNLYAGQIRNSIDFGLIPNPGEIRGTAFIDAVENGVYDPGEPLRTGIVVYLDMNINGRRETTEPTMVTGADGRYAFQDLDAEMEYVVAIEVPANLSLITPSTQTRGTWNIYLPAGGTITDRDFGFVPVNTGGQFENGSLAGRIFNDLNGDGIIQAGEAGVPNITVYLDLNNNEVRDFNEPRTVTDTNGNYSFPGLGNRGYSVRTILPTGTSQSSPLGSKFAITTLPLTSASTQLANPQDVLAEDLNGDGWSDLATALYSGNNVSIRLNNGSGGFTSAPVNVATAPEGLGPIAIATGRLNAGDAFDLITANQLNGTATIFLDFNGTGFASKQTLAVGNEPTDVVLGRFDEDSDTDAMVALKGTNQLVMLINNGAGSFTKGIPFSSGGNQPTALATGFFNNDTILDIAVANYGTHPSGADFGNVAILVGRGDGTFNTPVTYSVGFGPISIASGDFNGDGFADLVTANFLANTATVLFGSASGAFTVDPSPLGVGQGPLQVSVADIEGDGDRDILVTNLLSQSISILRNRRSQGGSAFEPAESFGVAEFQTAPRLAFAAADFDRNTTTDLALVNSMSETLRIFNNTLVNGAQRIQSTGVDNLTGLNFGTRADVLLPKMTPITNPEPIVEDSPQQVIALSGIAKGREGGPALRITATSSDDAMVPHPTVDYVAGQSNGQIRYTPSENQFGQATITVTLRDAGADQTLDTADDGVLSRMFTVTIRPVNDAPTFTVPRSRNTLEDAPAQVVAGFVTNIGPGPFESMQTLSDFTVTVDKPALFSAVPTIDRNGTLRFTPAANASGTAVVTVSLSDDGDTSYGGVKTRTDQFLIILDSVNDAPSINMGGKQTVQIGSATQTVANFATGFMPGGGSDENTQTIAGFVIGVDKPELFAVLPAISTSGTLTYTPSTTRTGTARVSVQVRDSGGSANGGVDVSSIKTFEIEVTALPDTTAPTPTISATVPNPTNQASFDMNIDFGEPVTGFALTDLVLSNATVADLTDLAGGRYSLRMTAIANGIVSASIPANAAQDLANNASLASTTFTRMVDTVTPSVSITTTESNPTTRLSFPITIQFSEPVLGFDASDVVLGNATLSNWSEPQPGRFTATLTALSDGVVFVGFSAGVAHDAAGNPNSSPSPLIHSINSGSATYKPLLTTTEPSPSPNKNWIAELDFGRSVTGFEASDLQITNGAATISDLGSGKYRINATSSVEGDVRVSLPANRVIDVNNRPNDASDPVIVRYVDTTNSDLGDAPAPYPTKIVDNGPFHRRGTLFLGTQIDAELDGQPNINATGDNTNGANDEDGIIFPMTLIVSSTTTTQSSYIVTSSVAGRLDAWIDFNGDGDWSDSGERIANALAIPAGRSIQNFILPVGAMPGTSYARFRLSSIGGLNVTGPAVDGEVEDYAVTLVGGTGKELALQATELGAHQVSVVGNRILIGNQGAIYVDVPTAQIARLQGIETGGVVRYDLTGIGGGLPGVVRYPGSTGMVSLVGTAASINITQYGAEKLKGIEAVDLQPSESSTLLVTPADVRAIHESKRLRVLMNANDSLATTANWKFSTGRIESGVWIQPYTQGDATLEVVGARPWRNDVFPLDVDGDQSNSPLDVLTLVNAINSNAFPGGKLPSKSESSPSAFYDPDGDGNLSPLDVLMVVNELNRSSGGEGEGELLDRIQKPMTTIAIDQVMTEDMEELFSARRSSPRGGWTKPTKTTTTR